MPVQLRHHYALPVFINNRGAILGEQMTGIMATKQSYGGKTPAGGGDVTKNIVVYSQHG